MEGVPHLCCGLAVAVWVKGCNRDSIESSEDPVVAVADVLGVLVVGVVFKFCNDVEEVLVHLVHGGDERDGGTVTSGVCPAGRDEGFGSRGGAYAVSLWGADGIASCGTANSVLRGLSAGGGGTFGLACAFAGS